MKKFIEFRNKLSVDKIDECIAHITLILELEYKILYSQWGDRRSHIFF